MTSLESALNLLSRGFWPVPITPIDDDGPSPGKRPIGEGWGEKRHTAKSLRAAFKANPHAGVGLVLGPNSGISDIEVEDKSVGEDTLSVLLGGECFETMGWSSERGPHYLFRWDERLRRYKNIIKGTKVPGVELRLGHDGQFQSVCPPSPSISGRQREWNGIETIAALPECFFAMMDQLFLEETEEPKAGTAPVRAARTNGDSIEDRARAYLAKLPEAVEHQRGHDKLYHAACVLVDNFLLSYQQALPILRDWNRDKAIPPESDKQVEHKLTDAIKNSDRSGKALNGDRTLYSSAALARQAEEWESPSLDSPPSAAPFPLDVFPPDLSRFVNEAAECLTCPPDFLAMAVLAISGAVIGRSLALIIKDSWVESPALYAAFVARPGATKSPALALVARPLWDLTEELITGHKDEVERLKEDRKRALALRKARQDTGPPPPDEPTPTLRRIAVGDSTCEAMAGIRAENPRGIIMIRDELTAWVASLNQYKAGGKGSDRQFFLSAWSGAAVTVDRKSHLEKGPIHITHPFLSVIGAMTPEMLCELADAKDRDDGFIDRLLFALPDPVQVRWNPKAVPAEPLEDWGRTVRYLWNRPMTFDDRGKPRPFFVRFTPPALSAYAAWFDDHCEEAEELDFPRHLDGAWSKMRAYCARLALILDQLHRAYDPTSEDRPLDVGTRSAEGAIRLIDYFKDHCRRVRSLMRGAADDNPDARAILRWAERGGRDTFSESDARHNFPSRFGDRGPDLDKALDWLKARSYIRPSPDQGVKGVGRPKSKLYQLNPKVLGHMAAEYLQ